MKYALGLVVLVAALSFAGSDFSGGCAETFGISGYTKAWIYMNGTEDYNPANTFRAYNWTSFTARLNDNVYGSVGTQFATYNGDMDIQVCDAFLNMDIIPELSIKAGQFKIPFGYAFNCAGGGIYFLDRAAVTGMPEFTNYGGRDVGLKLHGQFDMVGIDVAYFNGTGAYTDADTTITKEFAALLTVKATDWLTVAGGVAMIGQPAITDTSGTVEEWSATGIDAYVLVDYPISENADLIFQGEFLQSGYAGPEVIGGEWEAGMAFYGLLGVNIGLENSFLTSIMPAVRYESLSPYEFVVVGADAAEDNITVIDGCLNCYLTPMNDIQIGVRNVAYEADTMDGYTDMYLGWRMNF
ncbi:hypothetical protein DRQ25_13030 [Candidatus Fermentibacteria bacterium]|nr:MAG: hypothetical protein DRQ25_13030 [Candidatus Fermentibacteria bacterium]